MKIENAHPPARRRRYGARGGDWLLHSLVFFGLSAPAALAERTVDPPEPSQGWLSWALMIAFAGLCCGIAFKNPKRSHQA